MQTQELFRALTLPAEQRYRYFLAAVREKQAAWTLKGPDGFVSFATDEARKCRCMPFWPHPEHAALFATEMWADTREERIDYAAFVGHWLQGMSRDRLKAAVFPTLLGTSIIVTPEELIRDLIREPDRFP